MEHNNTTTFDDELNARNIGQDVIINERFTMWGHGYVNKHGVTVLSSRRKMDIDIGYVYRYVYEGWAKGTQQGLLDILSSSNNKQQQEYKALNFETVSFSGRFSYRNAKSLVEPSPFMTLDVDHLGTTEQAREVQQIFIADQNVETALCFLSPRQEGVKWVIRVPEWCDPPTFRERFFLMVDYVGLQYGIKVDSDGSDICRTCYLGYDPQCYCNPRYLKSSNNNQQQ